MPQTLYIVKFLSIMICVYSLSLIAYYIGSIKPVNKKYYCQQITYSMTK